MNNAPMLVKFSAIISLIVSQSGIGCAQTPGPPRPQQQPSVVSPEVKSDRHITFRVLAPKAETMRLNSSDIPGGGQPSTMTKGTNGVWEVTVGPVDPGAYRYSFVIDGVNTVDPRNPAVSQSVGSASSVVVVPGSEWMDTKNVPHGSVASVTYYSQSLSRDRRMHVYTPPGYETGKGRYPVFYLLHGAGDSDDSWISVGRAGFILDNLIAAGKAKPMIMVMPAGHTGAPAGARPAADEFEQDFMNDIAPNIEKNYRVMNGRNNVAIAGLSMGGGQTLNLAIAHQEKFAYVGVFSSGLFNAFPGQRPGAPAPAPATPAARSPWEEQHLTQLDNAGLKKGLKLFWFSTGKDDFLLQITHKTVDMLKKHGFNVVYEESGGGHTWLNWRDYLIKFVPQLFR